MAIYRGPGGSGDAVNDASSETRLAVEARDAAIAAKVAAETAQAAAELAETHAETAETNAETAETNAETAATNAASSASSASTSATSASNSASAASTSATNAASSASSASSSASAASTSATNAATSATNASNSASTASTAATNAGNSATAAASSASSASSSASTATTQASNASTSATNAASSASSASSSASTATTQAGIATTQATNASNSASAAATSATNASNSASAASTSASNAATSATAAQTAENNAETAQAAAESARDATLAAYDSFDDRYLGVKSSDPTLDNDGNALAAGSLYFSSTDNAMKVYTGSAWVAAYVSGAGTLLAANNLSDVSSVSSARTNLGLGTAATTAATDYATAAQGAKADTALQPAAIGVSVQAYDADLAAFALKTAPTGAVVGTSDTQTLTNKTIALGSNTVSGTLAQFNTAVTDADFASIAGTETLTNKTLTSPALTSPSISSGNLSFGTTGQRITGDFSNATVANRVAFQTSTTNGNTIVGTIPNGTSTISQFQAFGGSDIDNTSQVQFANVTNNAVIAANRTGTGTFGNILFNTGGSERLRIDTSGNVGIGTSSPAVKLDIVGASGGNAQLRVGDGANQGRMLFGSSGTYGIAGGPDWGGLLFYSNNATERMRIDTSGNVGIGTTSPGFPLDVQCDAGAFGVRLRGRSDNISVLRFVSNDAATTYGQFDVRSTDFRINAVANIPLMFSTNNTERMRISSTGNLGVGTTSPSFQVQVDSSQEWAVALRTASNTATHRATYLTQRANGSLASPSTVTAGTIIGGLEMGGYNSSAYTLGYNGGAAVVGFADGTWTTTSCPTYLTFSTNPSGQAGYTERMRINASGDVGIGTSSFAGATKLTIKQSSTVGLAILSNANDAGVYLWNDGNKSIIGSSYEVSAGYKPLTFETSNTERMRITTDGLLQFNSGYGSVATAYGCRAWVNFNGTGTVAIRASGNVSSITDNGTGDYTVNFTTAMPDVNYAWTGMAYDSFNSVNYNFPSVGARQASAVNTGSLRIATAYQQDGSSRDFTHVYVALFR